MHTLPFLKKFIFIKLNGIKIKYSREIEWNVKKKTMNSVNKACRFFWKNADSLSRFYNSLVSEI